MTLQRKTGLKSTKGLTRTAFKRGKPMPQQSAKRKREQRERRAQMPEVRPACQWPDGCGKLADDWNEILLRSRGGSITDPKNRVWLCRGHHDYFHAHPKEMHALGLMPHAWETQGRMEAL